MGDTILETLLVLKEDVGSIKTEIINMEKKVKAIHNCCENQAFITISKKQALAFLTAVAAAIGGYFGLGMN